ncbi:MAG: hypothetical protein ABSG95_05715 [Solirubrobacteraceae bacterium]|jgi:hypothetical protein
MTEGSPDAVDLVINTFERTYRRALEPGALAGVQSANRHPFARRIILINNVDDPSDAARRAQRLLDDGGIDGFHFVADHLDDALEKAGLRRRELEPLLHYSDAPLVAATLPGSPWLLYWDPEARLLEPMDWITPALELMKRDTRVMVANPSWELPDANDRRAGVEREAIESGAGFALGHGFSDQVFLASRADLAAPIYRQRCIARISYPGAHKAHVFEARVAAHMRHHGRLRATSLTATYAIDAPSGRSSYPPTGVVETVRYIRNALALRALRASPWRPACLRHTWL